MCTLIPAGKTLPWLICIRPNYPKHLFVVCSLFPTFLITNFQDATLFKSFCIYQPIDLQFTATSYIIYLLLEITRVHAAHRAAVQWQSLDDCPHWVPNGGSRFYLLIQQSHWACQYETQYCTHIQKHAGPHWAIPSIIDNRHKLIGWSFLSATCASEYMHGVEKCKLQ